MRSTRTVLAATTLGLGSLLAVVAITSLLAVGCGKAAEKASEKLTEEAIEAQTGGEVDIDTSGDGEVSVETEDGSATFGGGDVPAEWPEDLPLPDGLVVSLGTTADGSDGRLTSVIGTTEQSAPEVLDLYREALADWTISGETTATGAGAATTGAQWETEGRRFTLAVTTTAEGESSLTMGHTALT